MTSSRIVCHNSLKNIVHSTVMCFRKLFQLLMLFCGLHCTPFYLTLHQHWVSTNNLFFFLKISQTLPFFYLTSPIMSPPLFLFTVQPKLVKTWFDRGAVMQNFQSAAQKVLQGKGLQGMKSYMQRQPAPQSSQCRDKQPCNSSPAEVSARSPR